ncbi:cache domain-containing sensor histidine kinase [Cohnella thermotolerans]|jgi:two-component system sensor histidine kinase YesM|uniref:cache domain-containing sensor histidine kinase n=1 Tax=Cohnella thermotolerans TaxID=329858 RepID=UPI000479378C|nr:sensor histidine kinase [Cohnella thermotolerans]
MAKLREMNTLRNQIFAGFTLTMIVVLTFAGVFIYGQVSALLRNSAEKHIQQTAVQANGRLDALLDQVDTLTTQIATNDYVQKLMLREESGIRSGFNERQSLLQIASSYMAYLSGIQSLELYTKDYRRLFPLDEINLESRVDREWIDAADAAKGRLVWAGLDPRQPGTVLAIRRISLIDRSYSAGGYLTVHLNRDYFVMNGTLSGETPRSGEYMLLADGRGQPITSDLSADDARSVLEQSGRDVLLRGEELIAVRQHSETSGWTLVLLTPVHATTEGISVLRTAIFVSIGIGAVLFLLLTLLLSTMMTRPILKLMKTMRGARLGGLKPNPSPAPAIASLEIRELNNTYNQMVTDMNELIRVVYEKELTQSRTELKALQAQINPHFLFNTLEAFYWSLEDKGEEELAGIVVAMSGLFRYVIGGASGDEWVTVRDELEHAERYLQIMQMRLGDRLNWSIDADPALADVPIPKLLVQPLVENAILHGVENKLGPGTVTIEVARSERPGFAVVTVRDDGPGMDEEKVASLLRGAEGRPSASARGAGVAMSNVQRRLKLYFPQAEGGAERDGGGGLRIESEPGKGTAVSFEIAIPNEEGNRS